MTSFEITSPVNGKSFSSGSVIEASGSHSVDSASFVWSILRDIFGHFYLQNPPVILNPNGGWQAKNLHLGHDILEILFVQVNPKGNEFFPEKSEKQRMGCF